MAVHYGRNFAAYARDDFINVYISMIKPKAYHIRANKSWAKKVIAREECRYKPSQLGDLIAISAECQRTKINEQNDRD